MQYAFARHSYFSKLNSHFQHSLARLLNLSKSAIHTDDTNLAKAFTSGACNLIFSLKKNKLGAYWRLVTQVYPIFPLKKNKLGAYWWLVTQVYPTYLRLNYIILHKNIQTSNLLAAMYVSNILKFLNPIFKQVNQRLISTSSCQQGGWEGNKYIFFPLTLLLFQNIELHFAAPSWK